MKRRAIDRAIGLLAKIGLKTTLRTSRFHSGAPVKHFRFDPVIYDEALARVEASYQTRKTQRHEEFKKRRVSKKFAFAQNEQKAFAQNEQILVDLDLEKVSKKDMHPTPKGDGVRSSSKSKSKDQPTPNPDTSHKPEQSHTLEGMPKVSDNPQVSPDTQSENVPPKRARVGRVVDRNTSSEKTPNDYQRITGAVAELIFGIKGDIPKQMIKRIGLVAGYLWGSNKGMSALRPADELPECKADNIIADLQAFMSWWGGKFRDASPPRDLVKFAEHWLAFWATRKQVYVPVKIAPANSLVSGDSGDKIVVDRYIPNEGFTFDSEDKS
jgi:hypothetical protein